MSLDAISPRVQNSSATYYTYLILLSDETRHIFFGVFIVLATGSLIGNLAVIYTMTKRNYRFIQKTSIISLALSDLVSTISIAVNNLETFSHPLINWTIGEFLCSFVPFCQFWGMTASALALVVIAVDRYRNVVHALSKKWNPSKMVCFIVATILWLFSAALSTPMFTMFTHTDITILYYNNITGSFYNESSYMCLSFQKHNMKTFYYAMMFIIFLPLLLIFLWLYYNIAKLIWKHRKPISNVFIKKQQDQVVNKDCDNSTTKSGEGSTQNTNNSESVIRTVITKTKDVRMERKIRTFKIIITLMLIFLICRLPTYIYSILKLTEQYEHEYIWIINYSMIALGLVNCILNCLLYTFLNQTLIVWNRLKKGTHEFITEIICCFSKTEFEEFENGNPFVVENFENRKVTGRESGKSKRSSRVKFEEPNENFGTKRNKN